MKDKFLGFFSKTEDENNKLWDRCLFVVDANILLNLYRYSDETRVMFLTVLEKINDRIWIPHRVAAEYFTNRLNVIYEQQEEYTSTTAQVVDLRKKLENSRKHPFVSGQVMKLVEDGLSALVSELEGNKQIHTSRIASDEIKEVISNIFDGRVGDELPDEELEELISLGEKRYAEKKPPGYSDAKKASDEKSISARSRPYGDLIIWLEIIKKSKLDGLPVIFVTDDGKEDWWLRFKGQTIGPRPELIKEFNAQTGNEFHMYHPDQFLSFANGYFNLTNSAEALREIKEITNKESQLAENDKHLIASLIRARQKENQILFDDLQDQEQHLIESIKSYDEEIQALRQESPFSAENYIRNIGNAKLNMDDPEYYNIYSRHVEVEGILDLLANKKSHAMDQLAEIVSRNEAIRDSSNRMFKSVLKKSFRG